MRVSLGTDRSIHIRSGNIVSAVHSKREYSNPLEPMTWLESLLVLSGQQRARRTRRVVSAKGDDVLSLVDFHRLNQDK
jgi:hypothetical protein